MWLFTYYLLQIHLEVALNEEKKKINKIKQSIALSDYLKK